MYFKHYAGSHIKQFLTNYQRNKEMRLGLILLTGDFLKGKGKEGRKRKRKRCMTT